VPRIVRRRRNDDERRPAARRLSLGRKKRLYGHFRRLRREKVLGRGQTRLFWCPSGTYWQPRATIWL